MRNVTRPVFRSVIQPIFSPVIGGARGRGASAAVLSGTARPGQTLNSSKTGQWKLNGATVSGATANTWLVPYNYVIAPGDLVTQGSASNTLTVPAWDTDAASYIAAVITAGSEFGPLAATRQNNKWRIDDFVLGLKSDSQWAALEASCLLCAASDLTGALVPFRGTAPTNVNFVGGDYSRTLGLQGGATKYLNPNRLNNVAAQNSRHGYMRVTSPDLRATSFVVLGTGNVSGGSMVRYSGGTSKQIRAASTSTSGVGTSAQSAGGSGYSRNNSANIDWMVDGSSGNVAGVSTTPSADAMSVFAGSALTIWEGRGAFYSFGSSINLALLDARITTLLAGIL